MAQGNDGKLCRKLWHFCLFYVFVYSTWLSSLLIDLFLNFEKILCCLRCKHASCTCGRRVYFYVCTVFHILGPVLDFLCDIFLLFSQCHVFLAHVCNASVYVYRWLFASVCKFAAAAALGLEQIGGQTHHIFHILYLNVSKPCANVIYIYIWG